MSTPSRCEGSPQKEEPPALLVTEPDTRVGSITERLIIRLPASAKGYPVPHLVGNAVGGYDLDVAAYPERAAYTFLRILHQDDGRGKFRLDWLAGGEIPGHQPSGRALADLTREGLAFRLRLDLRHRIPDFPVPVAEPSERAERLDVRQCERGPIDLLRLLGITLLAGRLRAIKPDLGVGSVAEWFFG